MREIINNSILRSIPFKNRSFISSFKMTSYMTMTTENIIKPLSNDDGTVIFLHGSGDTGHGAKAWVEMLLGSSSAFPHLKVLFPTAPVRQYTPLDGNLSNVWFDRLDISPDVPEHLETIDSMAKEVNKLIEQQVAGGTPLNRIVLGGFSMGGAMALHVGYRYMPKLAGIFALSSFLNHKSIVFEDLKRLKSNEMSLPPLFMSHGERDDLVKITWGEETFNSLTSLGVTGQFHRFPNMLHELKKKELNMLYSWIKDRVKVEKTL